MRAAILILAMINILSIRCGLAFAPYLSESLSVFLRDGRFASRVIRQGGSGLITRSDAEMMLRYQHSESALGAEEARHYSATVSCRKDFYDIARMQDEVVVANVGSELLLSHPQSELWLKAEHISSMLAAFDGASTAAAETGLPDWLNISTGAGQLLISDQRNGRWVLLGADHIKELERRLSLLTDFQPSSRQPKPPTISVKGIAVHLQSAMTLVAALEAFAETGQVAPYEESTPVYRLTVSKATEGMEIRDSEQRAGLNAREARKWAAIIRSELDRAGAAQIERGRIRTVIARGEQGRWALQWGDEVFVPNESLARLDADTDELKIDRIGEMVLILTRATGACVALTDMEVNQLIG
ncbi:MAG TPA: hypothetical protein VJX74_13675 [Blastocatellia bacterium]|nr:hypothetical protein [Blastocatellia bacterium]